MQIKVITQGVTGKHSHTYASIKSARNAIVRANVRDGQLLLAFQRTEFGYSVQLGYPIVTIRGVRYYEHAEDGAVVQTRL